MSKLKIYRGLNVFAEPEIDLQTEFNEVLMGVDEIVSNITSPTPLLLEIDDYVIFRNENYFIDSIPEYNKVNEDTHQYTIRFKHPKFRLNADFISHLSDTQFTYFGDARAFMELLLGCIHTFDPDYVLGEIEETEQIFISFDGATYLKALGIIAEAFGLEYKIRGKVIDLKKQIGTDTTLTFEYGRGKGLYSLTRKAISDENVINKVYGFGSSDNIDYTYRNGAKRLTFEGGFITAVTPYGLRAGIYTNDKIKPERTAPCTGIEPIVGNGFAIYDTSLDFDIRDYFQEGTVPKVIFKSGELAGGDQEFEITGYNHLTKKISLSLFKANDGYIVPNETFMVQVGDQFSFIDMNQPESYVVDAEGRLRTETQAYLDENKIPKVAYDLPIDPKYIRTTGASLRVGDLVTIIDSRHGVNHKLRIVGVRASLADENQIKITIANFVPYTFEERVIASAINNQKEIKEVIRTRQQDAKRASINLRTLAESIFDTDGLFDSDKINVGVLSAALGIFGVQSQNFSLSRSLFKENYGANANSFQITNGLLIHREIQIVDGGDTWVMDGVTVTDLVTASLYYVYAKISKSTLTGTYLVTTEQIKVEDQAGHYVLLVGVLYPVLDGTRDYDATHGVSTISGGRIQTGEISSLDGFSKWNLDVGSLKLGDKFNYENGQLRIEGEIIITGGNAATNESVDEKVDAVQVGGVNMLHDSKRERSNPATNDRYYVFYDSGYIDLDVGVYTLQMEIKIDPSMEAEGVGLYFYGEKRNGLEYEEYYTPIYSDYSGVYKRYFARMTVTHSGAVQIYAALDNPNYVLAPASVAFTRHIQLETGNKPGSWSLSTFDIEADAQSKANYAEQAAILAAAMDATDKINDIEIGGRNLVKKSNQVITGTGQMMIYQLSEPLVYGETYTASMNGTQGDGSYFQVWVDYASQSTCRLFGEGTASRTFIYGGNPNEYRVTVYSEQSPNPSTINWIQITKGNKTPIDWSPAPEDIRTDLRLTAALPSVITLNEEGVTARLVSDPNKYARLNGQGLVVIGGAVDIRTSVINGIGVQFNAQGITGWDNVGVKSFELNAATGKAMMRGADVQGKISADSGDIGGVLINSSGIKSSSGEFQLSNDGYFYSINGRIGQIHIDAYGLHTDNGLLSLDKDGLLYAQNVQIVGNVTATSGAIGDMAIVGNKLYVDGVPLIVGDKINASLIVADEVIGKKLRTGTSGTRVEINILDQGDIIAYNQYNQRTFEVVNGYLKATNVDLTGTIYAIDGSFSGTVYATSGSISGNLLVGTINANNVSIINLNASNITSGTIDANTVNIINLVAQNIKTANSGQRIEILQASNDFKMYDASNSLLMEITPSSASFGEPGIKLMNLAGDTSVLGARGLSVGNNEIRKDRAVISGTMDFIQQDGGPIFNIRITKTIGGSVSTYTGWTGTLSGRQVVNGIVT